MKSPILRYIRFSYTLVEVNGAYLHVYQCYPLIHAVIKWNSSFIVVMPIIGICCFEMNKTSIYNNASFLAGYHAHYGCVST